MIYVCSDIHGQYNLFKKGLKEIGFAESDKMLVLGDAIDRGPDPVKLLLFIKRTPNISLILGNHELMMKDFYKMGRFAQWDNWFNWSINGGGTTYSQLDKYAETTKRMLIKYLYSLKVQELINVNGNEFILCHSKPDPNMFDENPMYRFEIGSKYASDEEFSVWSRERVGEADKAFNNKIIVHGHTPTVSNKIEIKNTDHSGTWINVDCGCAGIPYGETGQLGFLRLDDMKEFYISPR